MKDKIFLPLLLIASIVLIAGFFVMVPDYVQDYGDLKHFEDSDMSFSFNKSWTIDEYDDALKTPFLSNSPSNITLVPSSKTEYSYGDVENLTSNGTVLNTSTTNATDVVIVQTEITKYDSLPEGVTIDEAYKSDSLYQLMNSTGDFSMNNSTTIDLGGKTAYQFTYTVSYITYQDIWVESNGCYYRILNQAPNSVFPTAESQFNIILNSIKFKN